MAEDMTKHLSDEFGSDEKIIEEITKAAQIHETLKEAFLDNFVFDGTTLSEWTKRLAINIPNNPTPDDMRMLWVALTKKLQVAGNYLSVASTVAAGLENGGKSKKADIMTSIAKWYESNGKKRPAVELIDSMAESFMGSAMSARGAAIIVKNFWKQRLDTLIEMRKSLEQLGINMNVERKYENAE